LRFADFLQQYVWALGRMTHWARAILDGESELGGESVGVGTGGDWDGGAEGEGEWEGSGGAGTSARGLRAQ